MIYSRIAVGAYLLGAVLIAVQPVYSQPYLKRVKHGQHSVGFSSSHESDPTRPSPNGGKGRTLQVNIWYPAVSGQGKPVTFYDYILLRASESNQEPITDEKKTETIKGFFRWPVAGGTSQAEIDSYLGKNMKTFATRATGQIRGEFPAVLLMHGSAADYSFLAEFLASHGFVVIHVPTYGYSGIDFDPNGKGMETQIRDYEFALSHVEDRFDIDDVFTAGFSFGGQSAVGLMIRNPNVRGVISLDGGIGSRFGARLVTQTPFYHLDSIDRPILHLYNPDDSSTNLTAIKGYVFADRYLIGFEKMQHGHFVSFGLLNRFFETKFDQRSMSPDGYEAIMELALEFLRSNLKNTDGNGRESICGNKVKPWISKVVRNCVFFEKIDR